jgi:hypothetical protein
LLDSIPETRVALRSRIEKIHSVVRPAVVLSNRNLSPAADQETGCCSVLFSAVV